MAFDATTTVLAALLGLVAGSFLNVVIHRLPEMLEREWHSENKEHSPQDRQAYNLAVYR